MLPRYLPLCLLLGGLTGYAVTRMVSTVSSEPQSVTDVSGDPSKDAASDLASSAHPPPSIAASLRDAPHDRLGALKAISQLTVAELRAELAIQPSPYPLSVQEDLLHALTQRSPREALAWALTQRGHQSRNAALTTIFTTWARTNPQAALGATDALAPAVKNIALRELFGEWARVDPEEAKRTLATLPPGPGKDAARTALIAKLTESAPSEALSLIEEIPEGPDRAKATQLLMYTWARIDPEAALAYAHAMTSGEARDDALKAAVFVATEKDPLKVIHWSLQNLDGETKKDAVQSVLSRLAQKDPAEAVRIAMEMVPDEGRSRFLVESLGGQWAFKDPAAALDWVRTFPAGRERGTIMGVAHQQLVQQNPDLALQSLLTIESGAEQRSLLRALTRYHAQNDPLQAIAWSHNLPPSLSAQAQDATLKAWASEDPQGLLEYAAHNPSVEVSLDLQKRIADEWADEDPQGAATWASGLQDSKRRHESIVSIVRNWTRQDPVAAAAWVATLPPDRTRDNVAVTAAYRTVESDPSTAFALAASLEAGEQRDNVLGHVMRNWGTYEPEAAREALQATTLPADEKAKFLAEIKD